MLIVCLVMSNSVVIENNGHICLIDTVSPRYNVFDVPSFLSYPPVDIKVNK